MSGNITPQFTKKLPADITPGAISCIFSGMGKYFIII